MVVSLKKYQQIISTVYCHNLSGIISLKGRTTSPKAGLIVPLENLTKICLCKENYWCNSRNDHNNTKTDIHPFNICIY